MTSIYLDYNATTPVDPQVLEAMLPFLRGEFGNPSSTYALGRRAHDAIERARAQVAAATSRAMSMMRSPGTGFTPTLFST